MELFFPQRKKLYPTPAGKVYLEAAREILGLQTRTRDSIRLLDHPAGTELHFGLSPHRGALLLARIFPKFSQYFPQVKVIPHEGYASSLQNLLIYGKVDLVFTAISGKPAPELQVLPIHSEEIVLAVPAFHRLAKHPFDSLDTLPYVDLTDFQDTSFVMPDPDSSLYEAVQPLFARSGFRPLTAFSSPNVVMAESMIRSGVGVGFLPANYMVKSPEVTYFRVYQPSHLISSILTPKGREYSEAQRFLIFLSLQHNASNPNYQIQWSQPLIDIVKEFDYTHYFTQYMED